MAIESKLVSNNESNFKKKKEFRVNPSVISYQISQVVNKEENVNGQEKQKLES